MNYLINLIKRISIFSMVKSLDSKDLITQSLIEEWEMEESVGEFSHFYYENIR